MTKSYYIYSHSRATTGGVFYIGKGQGRRAWWRQNRNPWWHNVANACGFTVRILLDGLTEAEALEAEVLLISMLGRRSKGDGPLVNITNGGDGVSGATRSGSALAACQRNAALGGAAIKAKRQDPVFKALHDANHAAVVAHPVLCVETSMAFDSLTEAALWLRSHAYPNAKGNKIGMCCAGKLKRAYGLSWRYLEKETAPEGAVLGVLPVTA